MTEVPMPADDRDRINAMVDQYRHQIERLYEVAYLQGQVDQQIEERDKLQAKLEKVSA